MATRTILVWLTLLPITLLVWAKVLVPCVFGCEQVKTTVLTPSPPPLEPLKVYTVCSFAGPCWEVVGRPVN